MGKLMKLGSKNNRKFLNHVIKRAHETNSEKKNDQIKMRDYIDRRATSHTFSF